MNILVDIDGVLAVVQSYLSALNTVTGKIYTEEDVLYYRAIYDLYSADLVTRVFTCPLVVVSMAAYADSLATVKSWIRIGHTVSVGTSRPMEVMNATHVWLALGGLIPGIHGIHFCDKVELAGWLKPDIVIDDYPAVLTSMPSHEYRKYLMNRPWNAHERGDFHRVDRLSEIDTKEGSNAAHHLRR